MPRFITRLKFWFHQNLLQLAVIASVCATLLIQLAKPGFPLLEDGEYFLSRTAAYHSSIVQGQLPPRWASTFNFGYGYPVLNFHAPLPFFAGSLLVFAGFSLVSSLKIFFSAILVISSLGTYIYLSQRFSKSAALTGAIILTTTPYFLVDIYLRGSVGEGATLALLPMALLAIDHCAKLPTKKTSALLSLAITAVSTAHTIMSPIALGFLLLYSFIIQKSNIKKLFLSIAVGILMTGFFWIPAIFEKNLTKVDQSPLHNNYTAHFPKIEDFFHTPNIWGSLSLENTSGKSFQLGFSQLVIITISLFLVLNRRFKSRFGTFFIIISILTIFVASETSSTIWKTFSLLRFMQFPWRLLLIPTFTLSILAAWLIDASKAKHLNKAFILFSALTLTNFTTIHTRVPYSDEFLFSYPLTSTAANEFDTVWFDRESADNLFTNSQKQIVTQPQSAQITINKFTQLSKEYQISTDQHTTVLEKTMYFPGWETRVNGELVQTDKFAQNHYGLISFELQPGKYQVVTKLTNKTAVRTMANFITLFGLILLVAQFFSLNKKSLRLI